MITKEEWISFDRNADIIIYVSYDSTVEVVDSKRFYTLSLDKTSGVENDYIITKGSKKHPLRLCHLKKEDAIAEHLTLLTKRLINDEKNI